MLHRPLLSAIDTGPTFDTVKVLTTSSQQHQQLLVHTATAQCNSCTSSPHSRLRHRFPEQMKIITSSSNPLPELVTDDCSSEEGPEETAVETTSSNSSISICQQDGWQLLLNLPHDLFARCIVKFLTAGDRMAFRCASRLCRSLVNTATPDVTINACSPTVLQAINQLPVSLPQLTQLSIVNLPIDTPSHNHESNTQGDSEDIRSVLQQQLPVLLTQLPKLSSLSYSGPTDRRQPGLDLLPAMQALAAAAAATADTSMSVTKYVEPSLTAVQPQQLTKLCLRAAKLPDSLLDAVGQLTHLKHLELTATTAINTATLSQLLHLTEVHLTVTPLLMGALSPLAGLRHLQVLHLAAISPARGWASALRLLKGCPLQEVELVFADICDSDMAAMGLLKGLTRLDLHCSRHLTPGCLPHLAQLANLSVLQLAQTGLQLGHQEMEILGSGCPQLTQLHAEFDLRASIHVPRYAFHEAMEPGEAYHPPSSATLVVGKPGVLQDGSEVARHPASGAAISWPPIHFLQWSSGCSVTTLTQLLRHCKNLKGLQLEGLGPNGDRMARCLATHGRQLSALVMSGCGSLSEEGCIDLAYGLGNLCELEMDLVPLPTVAGLLHCWASLGTATRAIEFASKRGPGIQMLTLKRCVGHIMSYVELLDTILPLHPTLQQLHIAFSDNSMYEEMSSSFLMSPRDSARIVTLALVERLPHLVDIEVTGFPVLDEAFGRKWEKAGARHLLEHPGSRDPCKGWFSVVLDSE